MTMSFEHFIQENAKCMLSKVSVVPCTYQPQSIGVTRSITNFLQNNRTQLHEHGKCNLLNEVSIPNELTVKSLKDVERKRKLHPTATE